MNSPTVCCSYPLRAASRAAPKFNRPLTTTFFAPQTGARADGRTRPPAARRPPPPPPRPSSLAQTGTQDLRAGQLGAQLARALGPPAPPGWGQNGSANCWPVRERIMARAYAWLSEGGAQQESRLRRRHWWC